MTVDDRILAALTQAKAERDAVRGGGPTGVGGGDEPPHSPEIERRVSKLEASTQRIELALATITEQLRHLATAENVQGVRTEIAIMSGKLDGKATATELAELRGRVGRIPTVPMLAALLAFFTAIVAKWSWVANHLHF